MSLDLADSPDCWSLTMVAASVLVVVACGDDSTDPPPSEATPAACMDGLDNDGDGRTDCADLECMAFAVCTPTPSVDAGPPPRDSGPRPRDVGPAGCSVLVDATGFGVSDSCSGNDICICTPDVSCETGCDACLSPGACEPAFPRRYRLVPIYAYVPATKPTGDGWDADGSGPDLFAEMAVDGTGRFSTATANDLTLDADGDFTAVYSGSSGDFTLVPGSTVTADVLDEDALDDDGAFTCDWSASPELARGRLLLCEGALGGFGALMGPL